MLIRSDGIPFDGNVMCRVIASIVLLMSSFLFSEQRSRDSQRFVKDDVCCLGMASRHSWIDSGTTASSLLRRGGRG
jgi:hypothetical protein